jgi:4'-phosphopantetheinyl transferase
VPGQAPAGLSLSGAAGLVLAAAAVAEIGVDHEPRGVVRPGVADVALTHRERAELARLPAAEQGDAVLRWWVRKEAVLKLTGHGLSVDPAHLEVTAPDEPPRLLAWGGPSTMPVVTLADVELAGMVAAVAVGTDRPLRLSVEEVALSDPPW